MLEMVIEVFYGLVEGAAERKWARRFFPVVMTIFLFLLVSNWLGLTPLFGGWGPLHHSDLGQPVKWLDDTHTVGVWAASDKGSAEADQEEERYTIAPMFRSAATDLNVTFALALVSMTLVQYFGVKSLGVGYFGKFIAVGGVLRAFTKPGLGCSGRIAALVMGLIDIFIGFVELISEIGKVISFSFRLFGNVFAGEVLLAVIAFLIPYLISIPFYGLELLVGVVQAMVFMMLTVAFFVVAISGHGGEAH
jgi:F-type H+-transporting ATPase subunit a